MGTTGQYDAHNLSQAGSTVVSPVDGYTIIAVSASGNDVINNRGSDTINAEEGTNSVFASGAAAR